ncbi:hypothetical protein D3C72_2551420 [compost metagenome]
MGHHRRFPQATKAHGLYEFVIRGDDAQSAGETLDVAGTERHAASAGDDLPS